MSNDIREKLKAMIIEAGELPADIIIEDDTDLPSIGFDSLDTMNLLFACEEELGATLNEDEIGTKLVFGELANLLMSKIES